MKLNKLLSRKERPILNTDSLYNEVIARATNFRWNIDDFKKQISGNESYLFNFSILRDAIFEFSSMTPISELDGEETLRKIAHKIYFTYKASDDDLMRFGAESQYSADVYKVYFFHLLSAYLHASKRVPGKTLLNFVQNHHPLRFNDPDSLNYRSAQVFSEEQLLRKARNRLLSRGEVYCKTSRRSAITKDGEHEWSFYYALEGADETVRDTFKRFGNLYKDIDKAISLTEKDGNKEHLRDRYKKFLSKLQKLKYKNYIELIKVILSHINNDKEYYGLNLYRLERRLQPYKIINEVNGLLACESELENLFLWKTVILSDISFPRLYQNFVSLPCNEAEVYAKEFSGFLQDIVVSSCLILDELVERETFGDGWENLFRTMINELAEDVLYNPSQLDFSIQEDSQAKFEKLLAAPVFFTLCPGMEIPYDQLDLHKLPF